ncbi:thioesterase II family protein [Pusillimonas minor]|uniref:Thioesterase n=1 Tax=Pusillimonas minor TaxID=2697024 RepID=A0A842HN06_9BURK|nr:alpha/beta fold hydrolase [Pusillimonas minor]MBC2768958.1 thioesterase [Pusillimonas minor]
MKPLLVMPEDLCRRDLPLLIVLPHAGGAAYQYAPLAAALKTYCGVHCLELPGRGKRAREPFAENFAAAVTDINRQVGVFDGQPWMLLGHSLGAHLGMALLRHRRHGGQSLPSLFFASGAVAPSAYRVRNVAALSSEAFWEEVRGYGGVPEMLIQDAEYRAYFETILRQDMRLLEHAPHYTLSPEQREMDAPIPVPVVAFRGHADPACHAMSSWQNETAFPLQQRTFAGGHFYLFDDWPAVAAAVRDACVARMPG